MTRRPTAVSQKLGEAQPAAFSLWCIVAAFGTYFCMYAFRKPFTAGTFETVTVGGFAFKTILVASQVSGYMLAKFLGIKFVSEMPAGRRAISIVVLIGLAQLALLLFALTPPPYNFVMLFLNGLPLGMVFGLVLAFLEGRRVTEALVAGLCASFIVASGVTKSIGRWLILDWQVSEYWMPFVTGLLFLGPLLLFVWMLSHIPLPSPDDIQHRSQRTPMDQRARRAFFERHAWGLLGLLATFVLLTVMRSIRDDFGVEIWSDMGYDDKPSIFTQSEMLVMVGVVLINGAAIRIQSNRSALLASLILISAGFVLVLISLAAYWLAWIPPFGFMVLIGLGLYIPYVAFHTTVFERLIAAFRENGNIGYLMYLADATGYLGYVCVMLSGSYVAPELGFLRLFVAACALFAVLCAIMSVWLALYYRRQIPRDQPPQFVGESA